VIIGFDNNISHTILDVFAEKIHHLSIACHHISRLGMGDMPDEQMFEHFSKQGGSVLVSCDVNITRRMRESRALIEHNLQIIILPMSWSHGRLSFHREYIEFWAVRMIETIQEHREMNLFKMPPALNGNIKVRLIT
jgi:PIN like domain